MSELARPFVQLWNFVEREGGYPGKVLFIALVVMLVVGFFTWFGNKR